jgi:hypothetical protein
MLHGDSGYRYAPVFSNLSFLDYEGLLDYRGIKSIRYRALSVREPFVSVTLAYLQIIFITFLYEKELVHKKDIYIYLYTYICICTVVNVYVYIN